MTNLSFSSSLTIDPFVSDNDYKYQSIINSEIRFSNASENIPFILRSHGDLSTHSWIRLMYCHYLGQLKGRLLTTKRIKDVMNTSEYPIMIRFKDTFYFMGKGFLALKVGDGEPRILFVACFSGNKHKVSSIEEIKFFVAREIFDEEHKAIQPAIKDFINNHKGDVVITNKVSNYVGDYIKLPPGASLATEREYKKEVALECITDVLREM